MRMEDNLIFLENGRRPQKQKNGRQPQLLFFKWNTLKKQNHGKQPQKK